MYIYTYYDFVTITLYPTTWPQINPTHFPYSINSQWISLSTIETEAGANHKYLSVRVKEDKI